MDARRNRLPPPIQPMGEIRVDSPGVAAKYDAGKG